MSNELPAIKIPETGDLSGSDNHLSWAACIPTLSRLDILQINIRCLLAQTRPPKQIIVVDASETVNQNRAALIPLFANTQVELIYEAANAKSSAVQRNQAVSYVSTDIIVFIDDDSLLFPDCAEVFLRQFETDTNNQIAGISLQHVNELPSIAKAHLSPQKQDIDSSATIKRKKGGAVQKRTRLDQLEKWGIWRFFRREILMQSRDNMFVPYDHHRFRASDSLLPNNYTNLIKLRHLPGYGMAVRTDIVRQELFNAFLLAYCPCEDLDASYRFGRHGFCVIAPDARLMHYEVEASRVTRMQATSLGISNVALFVHTNSDSPLRDKINFTIFTLRRLLGECLKDLLARRFTFPQTRGVFNAIPSSIGIFRRSLSDAQQWYLERQRAILALRKAK